MSVINTNIKSLVAQGALARNNRDLATAMERLSTGSRINSAADDAAGLSIATRMTSQVRGLQMAIKNAGDAMSVVETAEGASTEITDILQRMRELAVQSASDSNSDDDRAFLNLEVQQLSAEVDRIANTTQFNGINILDGSYAEKKFQIGANAGQTVNLSIGAMNSATLGVAAGVSASASGSSSASSATSGVVAEGQAATVTTARLQFNDPRYATQVTEENYAFTLNDGTTTVTISATTVDFTSQLSRDNFVDVINEKIADAASNTTVTGSSTILASSTSTLDITDAEARDKLIFDIRIGDGSVQTIDLYNRLTNTSGVTLTAVTGTAIGTAMQTELQALYDDNVTVTQATATGAFTIADDHGRRIEVTQGSGSGFLFGTDSSNGGPLVALPSNAVNLSAAWESDTSDTLVFTNSAGGKIILGAFVPGTATSGAIWYAGDQTDGVAEPLLMATTSQTPRVLDTVIVKGSSQETKIAISSTAYASSGGTVAFKLQDSSGNEYFSTTVTIGLNTDNSLSATIRTDLLSAISSGIAANFGTDETIDISEFDVQVDRGTIIITNSEGRELQVFSNEDGAITSVDDTITVTNLSNFSGGEILYSAATAGTVIATEASTSDLAKGAVYAVTEFTMDMTQTKGQFDFELNGVSLAAGSTAQSGYVLWDSSADFATSTMKTKLDAMVSKINESHGSDVVTYEVSGSSITFRQLHGGALEIDNFKTTTAYATTRFTVTPVEGQGAATDLYFNGLTLKTSSDSVTAIGTSAVASTASLQLSGSDGYALTVSDGVDTYNLGSTLFAVGNAASADSFSDALEAALVGSGIDVSVTSGGNIHFTRNDGGAIYLTAFSADNGGTGTWTPGTGQGDVVALSGVGPVVGANSSSAGVSSSAGGASVAQISVDTQDGAEAALAVLDNALSYVNSERSKLGAIANRLDHTVDNLSNVVSATQAARSRILDTDYAAETAELARAQIIQQAATAMLAQANQQPQTVLALLQ